MSSLDLRRVLAGWEYEPNQITVRKIAGDDGAVKIQMRVDLGLLQMEVAGRPDGKRPFGAESLLDYHEERLRKHVERNGTELGYVLSAEECQSLREEAVQYYHRYLAEFVLEDFPSVERDTTRNLRVLDLCRDHASEEVDRAALEQYRPYLIMMNTRAQVHTALRGGSFKTALARANAGITMIESFLTEHDEEELIDESTELAILRNLRDEVAARLPLDPMARLEHELQRALDEERYEDAMVLRDRLDTLRGARDSTPVRKRKK